VCQHDCMVAQLVVAQGAQVLRPFTVLQDIYIARAEGELALEEELYWCVFTSCCLMLVLPLLLATLSLLLLRPLLAVLLTLCPTSLKGIAMLVIAGP
jgi:hypothetical protein